MRDKFKNREKREKVTPKQKRLSAGSERTAQIPESLVEEASKKDNTCECFLYTPKEIWDTVYDYYSSKYSSVRMFGTSAIQELIKAYSSSNYPTNILFIASNEVEVSKLMELVAYLSEGNIHSKAFQVIVVFYHCDENSMSLLANTVGFSFLRLKVDNKLTHSVMDKIMGQLIERTLPFSEPEKSVVNKRAVTKTDTFSTDLASIQKEMELIRSKPISQLENVVSKVEDILSESTSLADDRQNLSELPILSYLDSVSEDLANQLDVLTSSNSPAVRQRVEETLKAKLLISSMESKELEKVLEHIMLRAEARAESTEKEFQRNLMELENLKDMERDEEELLKLRDMMKKNVQDKLSHYVNQIVALKKVQGLLAYSESKVKTELQTALEKADGFVDEELVSTVNLVVARAEAKHEAFVAKLQETDRHKNEIINKASEIIKDLKEIIKVDDIIIDKLRYRVKTLEGINVVKRVYGVSKLEEVGKVIIRQPDTGLSGFMRHWNLTPDLIIYLSGANYSDYLDQESVPYTLFLPTTWDKSENFIRIKKEELDMDILKEIVSKASSYSAELHRIIFIVDADIPENYKKYLCTEVKKVIHWTDSTKNKLMGVNLSLSHIKDIPLYQNDVVITDTINDNKERLKIKSLLGQPTNLIKPILVPPINIDVPTHQLEDYHLKIVKTIYSKI